MVKTNYRTLGENVYYREFLFSNSLYYKSLTQKSGISLIVLHTLGRGDLELGLNLITEARFAPLPWTVNPPSLYLKINKGAIWNHVAAEESPSKHEDRNSWVTANTNSIWLDDRQV